MKGRILLIIVVSLAMGSAHAQSIKEDAAITKLMDNYVTHNQLHQNVRGWRVQILVTTDRRQMEKARETFNETFPDYTVHYNHENPFYHLKAGAFLTQAAARPFLQRMREIFSTAFIVADEIDVAEVLEYQ